jgi:IS30 family transposase
LGICLKNRLSCVSKASINQYIWKDKKEKSIYCYAIEQLVLGIKKGSARGSRVVITNMRPIENRPISIDLKRRCGDLEIYTIIGKIIKEPLSL